MGLTFTEVVGGPLVTTADELFRWRMGTRALRGAEWLQVDDEWGSDLAEKQRLRAELGADVVAWLPGSEAAAGELLDMVVAAVGGPASAAPTDGVGAGPRGSLDHPIVTAGAMVQEDLCLLERIEESWRLTAGSVCFPTRWSLAEKLGATLDEIHAPGPRYDTDLGERVRRFFDRLAPETGAWRLNWSLVDTPARRLEPGARQAPDRPVPPTDLWLRVERQTLRRLTAHEAICFGIRIHVWPLVDVAALLPARSFAALLDTMPGSVLGYKNLEHVRKAVVTWLYDQDAST
ncbi:MAG: DUF3445 domain-containing protein [Acidimicrobiales bacterium]